MTIEARELSPAAQWIESRRSKWRGNERTPPERPISELGATVADILAFVFRGIHNAPVSYDRVEWDNQRCVQVCVYGSVSTFDDDKLTRLVVRCHDLAVRCEIVGASHRYLRLYFCQRRRGGDIYDSHPTLEQAASALPRRPLEQP